jgi:DNA-binding response OmpR family regulator
LPFRFSPTFFGRICFAGLNSRAAYCLPVTQAAKKTESGRILIADDDSSVRMSMELLLQHKGYTCASVPDGDAAVRKLREETFDLLISDINMPGNDDLALVRQAAEIVEGLPIILLTGQPTVNSAAQSVRLPVMAYLVKPAEPKELLTLVRQGVANGRAHRALTASRKRLVEWANDLEKIEEALQVTPASKSAAPLNSYLEVTLQNLLLILMDWKAVMDAAPAGAAATQKSRQQPVIAALRETIDVLEKTKQSFKSRELGELRKKLEELLHDARPEVRAGGSKV